MTATGLFTSVFGKRLGLYFTPTGDQLSLNGVNVTSNGSSQTATLGNIQIAPQSFVFNPSSAGITAGSGGTTTNAVALTAAFNEVATVAATSDSVALPAATVGQEVSVFNSGANTCAVFPKVGTTDIINALTTGASFALGTSRMAKFQYIATGKWKSFSATASS